MEANPVQLPHPEDALRAPQPESSAVHSVTQSEVESLRCHRVRRKSLVNSVFNEQELNALRTVDAHLGAARMGLQEAADILVGSLQVKR